MRDYDNLNAHDWNLAKDAMADEVRVHLKGLTERVSESGGYGEHPDLRWWRDFLKARLSTLEALPPARPRPTPPRP